MSCKKFRIVIIRACDLHGNCGCSVNYQEDLGVQILASFIIPALFKTLLLTLCKVFQQLLHTWQVFISIKVVDEMKC